MMRFFKVRPRQLLLVYDGSEAGKFVLGYDPDKFPDGNPFSIAKKERVTLATISLLRPAYPIISSINTHRFKTVDFVSDGVEYELIEFQPCEQSVPKAVDKFTPLFEHGFILLPLDSHPLAKKIKKITGW